MIGIFRVSALALFVATSAFAYEAGGLSLDVPNVLAKGEGSFTIRHRFFGEASDTEKFLGTDDGGNMHFILKYALLDKLLLSVDHTRDQSGYGVGLEYATTIEEFGSIGARINAFSIDDVAFDDRQNSYFINTSYQTQNIADHVRLTVNMGYDAYYEHTTFGAGVDINMKNSLSWLTFTENLSLLGEYYPQVDKVEGISGKNDAYAMGVKFQTFGHHFELLLSNATSMDPRAMSLGTDSDKLHFGFNINRKF